MKKIKVCLIIFLILFIIVGCEEKKEIEQQPEATQIRAICNLATLKTYYHNVAKMPKEGNWIQEDRQLWIEYTGIATIGIDMSKVEMSIDGDVVTITMPKAELLSVDVDEESINKSNYYYSEDHKYIFKNEFTAEDETKAINKGQENMKETIKNNKGLLTMAQDRAKDLIQKYVEEMGELSNHKYKIEWNYIEE